MSVKRVVSVTNEVKGFLHILYNDCTSEDIPICQDCDIPPEENPGEWPDPEPGSEARCRIAIHVGEIAADRLNDFLSGLNLSSYAANFTPPYIMAAIAAWAWPVSVYGALYSFTSSLFNAGGAGIGLAAKNDYDAASGATVTEVQNALYCSLDDTPQLTSLERDLWSTVYLPPEGAFPSLLGTFVQLWPLDDLRMLAFNASINTASVNCAAFTCGDPETGGCEPTNITTTHYPGSMTGVWDTPIVAYGSGGIQSRSFATGEVNLTLPAPTCITAVRISMANQSGQYINKIQLYLDDQPYAALSVKQATNCSTDNNKSIQWLLPEPFEAQEIKFVATEQSVPYTDPTKAPSVIHCAYVSHGT